MSTQAESVARGVLNPRQGESRFAEGLQSPSVELAPVVLHYWSAKWDLRGEEPYEVQVLPSPSVQLVVEAGAARVHGVGTTRFRQVLQGRGDIFGISFRPAGFRPYIDRAVADFTDKVLPASEVFGPDAALYARAVAGVSELSERFAMAEAFLRSRHAALDDPNVATINNMVERVTLDRAILSVDDIAGIHGTGKRTLQRLFKEYVGVPPKWVIQRYRLHEAAERLHSVDEWEVATLAADLGYADQAHFARDFKAVVGLSPAAYARAARS